MHQSERDILAKAHQDYEAAFADLFELYCQDVYRVALSAAFYNDAAAYQMTSDIFTATYKYLHTFSPQHGSFRLYLFSLVVKELSHRENRVPPTKDALPKQLVHRLAAEGVQLLSAIQHLPTKLWLVTELWHGANLSTSELSLVFDCALTDIQQLQSQASQQLRKISPQWLEQVTQLYERRNHYAVLPKTKQLRMIRAILEKKRLRLTFVQPKFWQRLSPGRWLTVAGVIVLAVGVVLAVQYREPLRLTLSQQTVPDTTAVTNWWDATVTNRRPSFIFGQGELPEVRVTRQSLTAITGQLYGSSYVAEVTNAADEDSVQPVFTVNIQPEDFIPVETTYTYTLPEALTEDQLQYATLKHFISLPLNDFTYVNGTYYIADDPGEFHPLFIAFNNNGSIDYQMRQAAICTLDQLTDPIADTQAQTYGYAFLHSHRFLEADEQDLKIERISSEGRTVPKDAFCQDGDTTPVQDRLLVYYPPHTLLKYGENSSDELALRQRGSALQLHGQMVTNLRIDPLFSLLPLASRGATITLKSLTQAITELQSYHYPNEAERASLTLNATVFPQWNYSHGSDRFKNMTINAVQLEYVYDELNHTIEPYYVFTGLGTDGHDKTIEARWYVVASNVAVSLRGPYRE